MAGSVDGAEAEGAIAGCDRGMSAFLDAHALRDAGNNAGRVVTLAIVAHHAAQQFMHRQVLNFSLDVPQRKIERADGMGLFAARRIEECAVHVLPEQFDDTAGRGRSICRRIWESMSFDPPSPMPVIPASVSIVTTTSL